MKKILTILSALAFAGFAWQSAATTTFSFVEQAPEHDKTKVVFVDDVENLTGMAAELNRQSDERLAKLLTLNNFDSKTGNTLHLQLLAGAESILVVGSADEDGLSAAELQNMGGSISAALKSVDKQLSVLVYADDLATDNTLAAAHLAYGFKLRHYRFDRYKTNKREGESKLTFVVTNAEGARSLFENDLSYIAQGVHMARDLASEPGKNMYPEAFVEVVKRQFKGVDNIDIDVLDVRDINKLNMGALAGVGQGSIRDPRLLVIEYKGADRKQAPVALVGKGITFDTGGISLKSNTGMWAMKSDLSGAAAVAGTLYAVAQRGEKINLVGLMPLAENMPSQDAIRPGDVLETMKGTSIEIISTDAEGRLILADAVYYAQTKFKPRMLVNIATLTGSASRALSDEYAAVITRDFELSTQMMKIGKASGEHVWPLPLHANHFKQIESPIADIKNSGAGNPGASIGAAVVGTFVDESLPWVHLDIAGVDWLENDIDVSPKGSQGWGVRFMDSLVRDQVEE